MAFALSEKNMIYDTCLYFTQFTLGRLWLASLSQQVKTNEKLINLQAQLRRTQQVSNTNQTASSVPNVEWC